MESRSTMGVETLGGQFANRPVSRPDWYYALDGEQKGPVSAEDFERLVEADVVKPTTRVWSEGMADWQTLVEVRPAKPAAAPPPHASDSSRCGLCGVAVTAEDSVRLDGRLVCAACKSRAVQMLREGVPAVSGGAEQIRQAHLSHESSIRAVGMLYLLGGALLTLSCVLGLTAMLMAVVATGGGGPKVASLLGFVGTFVYAALAVLMFWLGRGLRRLNPSVRIVAAVIAGIGLIGFPIGTLINAYVLWLLLSAKGKTVFSEDYRRIVAETPHLRYRTPWWVWVLLALVVSSVVLLGLTLFG